VRRAGSLPLLRHFVSQTVQAASHVPGDFSVHPWPIVKPGYARGDFCHAQVIGGRIVMHPLQYVRSLIPGNILFPLVDGRCLSEVQVVEDVLKELAVPYLKVRVIGWSALHLVEKAAGTKDMSRCV